MKFYAHLLVVTFIFFLVLSGCKKSEDVTDTSTPTTTTVSDDEIADAVAKSVVSGEGGCGLTGVVDITGKSSGGKFTMLKQNNFNFTNLDSSFTFADSTQYVVYSYTFNLNIDFIRNGKSYVVYLPIMDTAKVSVTSYGTVAATNNKYKYDDTLTLTDALLTGISTSSDTITFSGTADYSSNFTIMPTSKTFALKTTMIFSSLKASKSTYKVSGGTVGITIQATIKGTTVSANGTITFNGNQTATLSFHNKQFVIDLNSGLVVA